MYCRFCGKELPNDSNFCPNCGKKQKNESSEKKSSLENFLKEHKKLSYAYFVWLLLHLTLFLSSTKNSPDGFYPWNRSISYLLGGGSHYYFSLLDEYNVYDFSEFFFYTIVFPIVIFGIIRLYPMVLSPLKKWKDNYKNWQESNAKKREENQGNILAYKTQQKEDSIIESAKVKPVVEEFASPEQKEFEGFSEKALQNEGKEADIAPLLQEEHIKDEVVYIETESEVKKMPLLTRFIGSFIDKVLILLLFIIGSFAVSPYGAAGRLGTYVGLMSVSPRHYEYIDRAAMNRYGTYNDGVSHYYQDMERLVNNPPYIGSTIDLDKAITFSFILFNLLYYVIFETIFSASLYKHMLGGVLLDSENNKIRFRQAILRAVCGGILMTSLVFLFHYRMGLNHFVIIIMFFLLMDLPVFFIKRSLLDICTGTTYVKQYK